MYRTIEDFIKEWSGEHESTLKMFNNLTDASLSQRITPETRSLGFLAWHITLTLGEMGGKAGLDIQAPAEHAPMPTTSAAIVEAYKKAGDSLIEAIKKAWSDKALLEEIEMYGEKWTRGFTLTALVNHQIHHRAQMTVLMRQAGLKVPGIYGPAKEEWAAYGMTAPE